MFKYIDCMGENPVLLPVYQISISIDDVAFFSVVLS